MLHRCWTPEEKQLFLECLKDYGINTVDGEKEKWKKVALQITTRTIRQICSYANKYVESENKTVASQKKKDKKREILEEENTDEINRWKGYPFHSGG